MAATGKSFFSKVRNHLWMLRSLPQTVWFNFHYLPFHQAVHLPILLYKPHFIESKGTLQIQGGVKFGMIRLGKFGVSIYPNNGIHIEIKGQLVFRGSCSIGNNSYISVSRTGHLTIGNHFIATASLRLISHYQVAIEDNVLVGWDTIIMDTNFHRIKRVDGKPSYRGFDPVIIGNGTWIANNVEVTAGSYIPNHSIIQAHTLVTKRMEQEPYAIYGGNPAHLLARGYYLNKNDCSIDFSN